MARIADDVIERLKQTISLERLAQARGIELKKRGADLVGHCPFHEDKTPSLIITPKKNLWHCMGACQQGGTVIDWVMKTEGISFRHAAELLQNDYLPSLAATTARSTGTGRWPDAGPTLRHSTVRKLPTELERNVDDARLLGKVVEYYHQTLLQSPACLEYLKKRGLESADVVRHFKLGYSNRTLCYRLPAKNRIEGSALRGQLQRVGAVRASGHEHFNGSLVVPIFSPEGEVTEIYGRKITDGLKPGTPLHMYLPGPHRGVWNEAALSATKEVILCEALIDALTFWCAGYRNVTASYGVEGFTADHLTAFKRHGIERVLIAYDRDEAGDKAAEKLTNKLTNEGMDCFRILFPKGMDANEYALKVGPAAKSLGIVIRAAQWLGKGKPQPIETALASPELTAVEPAQQGSAELAVTSETAAGSSFKHLAAETTEKAAEEKTETNKPDALPAQAIPDAPAPSLRPQIKELGDEREYVIAFAERRYRVRGLEKNASHETLKVNLLVSWVGLDGVGGSVHVDTFDLYNARQRASFIYQASVELGVSEETLKSDMGRLLLAVETEQTKRLEAAQRPPETATMRMGNDERAAALEFLKSPNLIERIAADFGRVGIVGETTNVLVGYLAAISRKLERPLALLIQSTSAAGKSSLLDAVLRLVPEEERIVYSAMTGQSLFYMGQMNLKHKLLAIAEEEGAARASYALKLLQSEGQLTIASTSKDATTGKLTTDTYHVEGPVMIALTTTAADIDEELLNRCLVLTVDEGREQTQAIHAAQRARRTLAGLYARAERESLVKLHQNAQRLLEPLAVVNPLADRLTFLSDRTRTRRDHEKYLTLIDTITLLHQHQRDIKTVWHEGKTLKFIEVTLDDIALANTLAHQVLGTTLDELPPQTRRLLSAIVALVESECNKHGIQRGAYRFSRRRVREHTHWGDTQLKIHLARLTELEYLLVHRGGRGQSFEYELLFDGGPAAGDAAQARHVSGLIDIEALRYAYDTERSGSKAGWSGGGRPPVGGRSEGGRDTQTNESPSAISDLAASSSTNNGKTHSRGYKPQAVVATARRR